MSDKFEETNPMDFGGAKRRFEPEKDSPTWPFVLAFAKRMEYKLSLNRHKGDRESWLKDSAYDLCSRAADEWIEMQNAVESGHEPEKIANEAADVANFAMMVADVALNGGKLV